MLQRYLYNISETPTYWIFLSCPVQPMLSLWNVPRTVLETVGDSKLGQSIDLRGETKRNHPLPFSVHHPFSETDILQVTYSNALIYSDIEFKVFQIQFYLFLCLLKILIISIIICSPCTLFHLHPSPPYSHHTVVPVNEFFLSFSLFCSIPPPHPHSPLLPTVVILL